MLICDVDNQIPFLSEMVIVKSDEYDVCSLQSHNSSKHEYKISSQTSCWRANSELTVGCHFGIRVCLTKLCYDPLLCCVFVNGIFQNVVILHAQQYKVFCCDFKRNAWTFTYNGGPKTVVAQLWHYKKEKNIEVESTPLAVIVYECNTRSYLESMSCNELGNTYNPNVIFPH